MKAVVFYESAADVAALAPVHGPATGPGGRSSSAAATCS